jgi:hypothetical protein
MNIDTFVSWLIHSDYFLLASWIVLLGCAFAMTFAESPVREKASRQRETPPAP